MTRPTGAELVERALQEEGKAYTYGAIQPKHSPRWIAGDCAEFASWLVYQLTGILYGCASPTDDPESADAYTGYWMRDADVRGTKCTVAEAARIPGAFLLRAPSGARGGHIAPSGGDGTTIEAHSTARGICRDRVGGRRWTTGVLPPGIAYTVAPRVVVEPVVTPILRRGATGPDVAELQRCLIRQRVDPGPNDGIFGALTLAAVLAFQARAGLVVDGEVGPETAGALGLRLA